MYQYILVLHVLAATVWTGGHIVLAVGILPGALIHHEIEGIIRFESIYEKVGIPALVIQIVSGFWLTYQIIPDTSTWFHLDSPVNRLVVCKFSLLVITAVFAVDARLRLIPNLTIYNLTTLAWHIIPITIISILFVVVGIGFRFGGL